jgi:hypothetical protein
VGRASIAQRLLRQDQTSRDPREGLGTAQFIHHSTRRCEAIDHHEGRHLTLFTLLALLPALLGMTAWNDDDRPVVRHAFVQDQMIIKVPVRPLPPAQFDWVERKGPRCLPAGVIRGALLTGTDHVDLVLPQHQRIRATFDDDCPALDFYGGFYLKTHDQQICARRDSVHSRMGGSCRIERFRYLVPKFKG